jgi:sec-independent protein translocase protein TatB
MELFGIGWTEMLVIGLVALIVVGPERLPQAARTIGNLIGYLSRQFKNIREEIRQPIEGELIDIKGKFNDTIREVTDIEPVKEKPEQSPPKQRID